MRRRRFLPLLALAAFILLSGCGNEAKPAAEPKTSQDHFAIKVGSQVVQMRLAIHPQELQQGLMYLKSMPQNEGMIFLYDRPQQMSFWMRNCEFPQDIGFFDSDGRLKEVFPMYPHDERPVQSLGVRQFALEMNQGWYRQHGLKAGDAIDLSALAEAIRARGMRPDRYGIPSERK
ncbi:MAG TPA: DUF192 domain-containing protein [Lacunisphaera sp.]|nr:DUF192 domain-containing protein [Lacunisphaera sp.]